jgi:hypothetical protein
LVSLNSIKVGLRTTTSNTTLSLTNDYFLCTDSTAGTITVTLPPSPPTGQTFLVKDCTGQAATHNVIVSGGTIDGQSSYTLSVGFQAVGFTWTGSQWGLN